MFHLRHKYNITFAPIIQVNSINSNICYTIQIIYLYFIKHLPFASIICFPCSPRVGGNIISSRISSYMDKTHYLHFGKILYSHHKSTGQDLINTVTCIWQGLSQTYIHNLYARIPSRICNVMIQTRYSTNY